MKMNIQELTFTIKPIRDKDKPDLLAHVSLKFVDDKKRNFNCNGFTLRKSKYENTKPYIAFPSKKSGAGFFKFNLVEKTLWKEIEREALNQYEYESIPVIN